MCVQMKQKLTYMATKTNTELILKVMHVLTWVAFIGLLIDAGTYVFSYFISLYQAEAAGQLSDGLNIQDLRQHAGDRGYNLKVLMYFDLWHYTLVMSSLAALSGAKAWMSWIIIRTLSHVRLSQPFTTEVANGIEKVSYTLLIACAIASMHNAHSDWLGKHADIAVATAATGEYLFTAGLVFILAQVFKRGVELQSESELTV